MSGTVEPPLPANILRRQRLQPVVGEKDYLPWVRAWKMEDCFLFWLGVAEFPCSPEEKQWAIEFLSRFSSRLSEEHSLRGEVFLQYKTIGEADAKEFLKYRRKCLTLMGLGRRPGASIPTLPTGEDLQKIVKDGKPFDLNQWVGDYSYWFIMKQPERQRELFLGLGGMTTIFLPPDPKTKAPKLPFTPALRAAHPAFKKFDVDAVHEATYAMEDAFLEKSKALFGAGLEEEVQYDGLAFILPLLDSGHFFAVTPELREKWFELFDVYVHESKSDKGFILAFKKDFEPLLLEVLESMHEDGLRYPGEPR